MGMIAAGPSVFGRNLKFTVSTGKRSVNFCRKRAPYLERCGMVSGGNGKKVNTREACYWITRKTDGFNPQSLAGVCPITDPSRRVSNNEPSRHVSNNRS